MSLKSYEENAWIRRHETSKDEISRLLAIADRDIAESQTPGLGPEWRFGIAYNAALQLATAALAASGYRAARQNKHMRTIECLEFTLGIDDARLALFDTFRRKRNTQVYDAVGAITDHEVESILEFARNLRREIEDWLRAEHEGLVD